jgi:polar amino acid transport system substrate-binding protein
MVKSVSAVLLLMASCLPLAAEPTVTSDVIKALAPTGKLRAAINYGNAVLVQKGANGEPAGVSPELARQLAKALHVPLDIVTYTSAGKTFEAAKKNEWDVAFFAIDPVRGADVEFTAPYVLIQGTYLVLKSSPLKTVGDVDKPGMRIGVGKGSVYDLYLTRNLKNATLVRNPKGGGAGGVEPFLEQTLDAAAGVREALEMYAADHSDVRVMSDSFQEIRQAMVTPKGRAAAGVTYLRAFVEEQKANGFVAHALKRSGQKAPVAPPEK